VTGATHLDWYMHDPAYAHVPRELRTAGVSGVAIVKVDQPTGLYRLPATDEFTLQLISCGDSLGRMDHGIVCDTRARAGQLAISPCRTELTYDIDGPLGLLIAVLPRERLRRAVEGRSERYWVGDFGSLHTRLFEDDTVRVLMLRLWDEAAHGSPYGALFADSAIDTVALALLAASGERFAPHSSARGGLAPWQVRRLTDFLEDRLADDVSLDDLSSLAGLSTFHVCRAFKQSTGLPPHAYLRRLRCKKAKALLTATDLPVTEIAAQVGYETPQAFARMFRAEVGTSPTEYRRERRS